MSTTAAPKIETIKLSDILIEEGYNVREPKEVAENAKDIAANMEATGDNPSDYVIRYVIKDGKKYTRNHATLIAAKARGWKDILARVSPHEPDSAADKLDLFFSNNGAHPISRAQQGRLFAELRDGLEKDQSDAIKNGKVGEEIAIVYLRAPMTLDEIAAAMKPARTKQHIADCIAIYESPEEIAALLEEDKTSANPVLKAKQWAKGDEKKWLRIVKRAIAYAKEQGSDKATQQHFDAIKSEFVEFKAVDSATNDAPASPAKASKSKSRGDDAESASGDSGDGGKSDLGTTSVSPPEAELFKEGTKKNTKLRDALITIFLEPENVEDITLEQVTAEALADKVLALLVTAREIF